MRPLAPALLAAPLALAFSAGPAFAQKDVTLENNVYSPKKLDPSDERVAALKVPEGFTVKKFAEGLGKPRMIAVAPDGTVYVTRKDPGDLLMLRDTDGDGLADRRDVVAKSPALHGIALDGDRMFLATVKEVFATRLDKTGRPGDLDPILRDLPDGGQHANRTLGIGPDGNLYVSVGSTCNLCSESNKESAAILRASKTGGTRTVFAGGLRNTVGFAWHPETRQMWGMDHGADHIGNDEPPEELNLLVESGGYGWPYAHGDNKPNPVREPSGMSFEDWAKQNKGSVLGYTAHAAPMQMAFYTGDRFPEEFRGDAFVAMRGSWNRKPPSGFEVVRIDFENGQPKRFVPFLTGFLSEENGAYSQFARPVGVAVTPDGALLIGDEGNGVLYRVTYGSPEPQQAENPPKQ